MYQINIYRLKKIKTNSLNNFMNMKKTFENFSIKNKLSPKMVIFQFSNIRKSIDESWTGMLINGRDNYQADFHQPIIERSVWIAGCRLYIITNFSNNDGISCGVYRKSSGQRLCKHLYCRMSEREERIAFTCKASSVK